MEQPVLSFSPPDTHQPPRLQTQKAKRHLTSLLLVRINTLNGRRLLSLRTPGEGSPLPSLELWPVPRCRRCPTAAPAAPTHRPKRGPAEERPPAPRTALTLSPPLGSRRGGRASLIASDFKTIS